jgi:DNA invertase Pin-like site-specific DNA recombinase
MSPNRDPIFAELDYLIRHAPPERIKQTPAPLRIGKRGRIRELAPTVRELSASGVVGLRIAERLGISQTTVSRILAEKGK